MSPASSEVRDRCVLERSGLDRLFGALRSRGFRVVGPTVRDSAIIYDELQSPGDLPSGWSDEQDGGKYRLKKRKDEALFAFASSPYSWKRFLHPPSEILWRAKREGKHVTIETPDEAPVKTAFVGVRACDLHAIVIQDRVFSGGAYVDTGYQARRNSVFIVAVNCGRASGTCFCVSMSAGPKVESGFDLALTEIVDPTRHYFVIEIGSDAGGEVVRELELPPSTESDDVRAHEVQAKAARQMGRKLDTNGVKELLQANLESPCWDHVAARCLNCTNCTMVCPTCFCTSVEDTSDLSGNQAERVQKWDSCFNTQFSYIHGGSIRPGARSRYRQWLTHKLASWIDQFGTTGCVGCGRCITWCPVGIDITEEVHAIRDRDLRNRAPKIHAQSGPKPALKPLEQPVAGAEPGSQPMRP